MAFKAVLFDLDGTLLNTLADIGNAANRVLSDHGYPVHPLDAYRLFVGDGARALIERIMPADARNSDSVLRLLDAFRQAYASSWNVETKPYDGIPEMLNQVRDTGVRMAVLSNKPHDFTQNCVSALLANWSFDAVYGMRDNVPKKPHPAGAVAIAREVGIDADHWLYVGDTGTDMQTAVAAGMFPLGVLWGFRDRNELEQNGAKALIAKPDQLVRFLT